MKETGEHDTSRRESIKKTAVGAAAISIGGIGLSAKSYSRIVGSNERLNFAVISVNMCHLANMAQFTGGTLQIDPTSGKILDHPQASQMLGRTYQPGWEPKV